MNRNTVPSDSSLMRFVTIGIAACLLPFFLLLVEKYVPYPVIVEEIAKAIIIFYLVIPEPKKSHRWYGAVIFALGFALSENIFYLLFFTNLNQINLFWLRFLGPTLMHLATVCILLLSIWHRRWLMIFGLPIAIAIHYFFNNYLAQYFAR